MAELLSTIQGIQASYIDPNTRHTRIYDAFKIVNDEITNIKKRLSALEVALAALGITTTVTDTGIEILVNGNSVGDATKLNFEGDDEIDVVGQANTPQVNVFISLASLQRRYRRLLLAYVQQGFDIPPDLENDYEISTNEEV